MPRGNTTVHFICLQMAFHMLINRYAPVHVHNVSTKMHQYAPRALKSWSYLQLAKWVLTL